MSIYKIVIGAICAVIAIAIIAAATTRSMAKASISCDLPTAETDADRAAGYLDIIPFFHRTESECSTGQTVLHAPEWRSPRLTIDL